MAKVCILAEKPSQAKAYCEPFEIETREKTHIVLKPCNTFPQGAVVTWGIGHLVSLKNPKEYKEEWGKWELANLPIIPEQFEFKVSEGKEQQFNAVKKLFKEADVLVNACDIDAEGSNIFYTILNMSGVKGKIIKRLWINSLEADEVEKGFNNLRDNQADLLLFERAKARQYSDWAVGINCSQLYTLLLRQKGLDATLSIGRCQSPLVYMIYQRQKEIENFESKTFFELFGKFSAENSQYEGKAKIKTDTLDELQSLLHTNGLTLNQSVNGVIKSVEKKEKATKSPKLHSLSTLQTVMNRKHKYSPAKVLQIMQSLYEKKLVTYPRTDTNYITENEFAYLVNVVEGYKQLIGADFAADCTAKKRYVDGSKCAEHYAIILTKHIPSENTLNALSNEEKNVYDEILRTTLAMFHSDYIYEETKIVTTVNNVEFETVGKVEVSKGWKELFSGVQEDDENNEEGQNKTLPAVSEEQQVSSVLLSKEGKTTPPKPYSEGGLINLMKTAGKLVEDEADSEILKEVEGIGTEATRANIIETVKQRGYIEVKKNIVHITKKGEILCEAISGTLLSSASMTAKWETSLQKIGEGKGTAESFVANTNKFIAHLIETAPKKIVEANIEQAISEEKQNNSNSLGTCPLCKKGEMIDKKTFVGCSEYKNGCKCAIFKTVAKKKLSNKNIKDLIEKGRTSLIKGFTSSKGTQFDAALKLDNEGKVVFDFNK